MHIYLYSGPVLVGSVDTATKNEKWATTESDSSAFSNVDELEKVMRDQDAARTEVVNNAAALVSQKHWPSAETIQQIAKLLAINIGESN
jgi:hypothetical protein